MFSFVSKEILMRRLYIFLFLSLVGLASKAQQFHFVYLQTDNKQPFYVRINEKLYSSSASGYVVIPKLIESMSITPTIKAIECVG